MAIKTTKTTKKTTRTRTVWGLNKISFYLMGAVAVLYLVATILSAIKANGLAGPIMILQNLAMAGMLAEVAYFAWKYIRGKQTVWKVLYFVLLLVVLIGIILPLVKIF